MRQSSVGHQQKTSADMSIDVYEQQLEKLKMYMHYFLTESASSFARGFALLYFLGKDVLSLLRIYPRLLGQRRRKSRAARRKAGLNA